MRDGTNGDDRAEGEAKAGGIDLSPNTPSHELPTYRSTLPTTVGGIFGAITCLFLPQVHVADLALIALAAIALCLAASMFLKYRLGPTWRVGHIGVQRVLFLAHASFGFALTAVSVGFITYLKG